MNGDEQAQSGIYFLPGSSTRIDLSRLHNSSRASPSRDRVLTNLSAPPDVEEF